MKQLINIVMLTILVASVFLSGERSACGQGASATPIPTPIPTPVPTRTPVNTARRLITTHPIRAIRHASTAKSGEKKSAPNPISLLVISTPPIAKVFADDELKGETDSKGQLELFLSSGTHRIRLTKEGYLPDEGEFELSASPDPQYVPFSLSPALASLNIVTDPTEAEVYLDDVYKGASNSKGLLVIERIDPSAPHTLRVRKDCYVQQATPVTSFNGQLSLKLLRECMKLRVLTDPPETEIYLDGAQKGTSTADGLLLIEQVNPNQIHSLRGSKRPGFLDQLIPVPANRSEVSIKLLPDPVVLLIKSIRQNLTEGKLVEAFTAYGQLVVDAPEHQELPRLLESLLQNLQSHSVDVLKRVDHYGLALSLADAQEISGLYVQARKWRVGDDMIESLAKYWGTKLIVARADETSSIAEKESLRRSAKAILADMSERSQRNMYVLIDLGWTWLKLNDSETARKYFSAAQELKPDWAYPQFALAVLAMEAAEREVAKKPKAEKYGQAIDGFTKAIALKRDLSRAYALRCISYAVLNRHEESAASGLQAATLDPQSAYAHFALGFAYFQRGKSGYRGARDEFSRALILDGPELDEGTKNSIQQKLAIIKKAIK
jgi:tetratricopeptide (TPR) repeat protein